MRQWTCVSCGHTFDVADDDPLWSVTTDVVDGAEVIVGRHIEPPCPECGKVTAMRVEGVGDDAVVSHDLNRIEVDLTAAPEPFGGHQ